VQISKQCHRNSGPHVVAAVLADSRFVPHSEVLDCELWYASTAMDFGHCGCRLVGRSFGKVAVFPDMDLSK
jgi:hypothetical protein